MKGTNLNQIGITFKGCGSFVPNQNLSNDDIIKTLTSIKGIGPWTAEMFLIFTLKRPDVFPLTDLGIQKGFKMFFSMDKMPSMSLMKDESHKWKPYRTIVSLYLWFAVEGPFEW